MLNVQPIDRPFFYTLMAIAMLLALIWLFPPPPSPVPHETMTQADHGELAQYCSATEQKSEGNASTALQASSSAPTLCCCCCHSQEESARPLRWSWDWWFDSPITIYTGLLLLVGAFQAYYLGQTNKATQIAAKAAEEGAKAAKASSDAVVSQLRAYISMKTTEGVPPTFSPVIGAHFAFDVRNTGSTPAFNMIHTIQAAIGPPTFDGNFMITEIPDPSPFTLAPQAVVNIATAGPAPQGNDALLWQQGQLAAYVYGIIEYDDAFGHRRFHKYCYRFMTPDLQTGAVVLAMTPKGNESN